MAGALSIFQLILYPLFLSAVQCCWERGQMVAGGGCSGRGEYMSQKIWNCLPWILGYFETVCPGQPENLQNCLLKHKVNIFGAMSKNIIDSHCAFNIKETQVLYIFFDLKCERTSTHIFCICLVQNCLSKVKISETVCESVLVLKLSVLKRTSKRLFIHPCKCL